MKAIPNSKLQDKPVSAAPNPTCTPLSVAKYIISYCGKRKVSVSHMTLQKLLYFVFGTYYREFGRPLFDEPFEAWQHGPMVLSVYDEFCLHGPSGIHTKFPRSEIARFAGEEKEVIDQTIEKYMEWSPFDLIRESKASGGAWEQTTMLADYSSHPKIENSHILDEFANRNVSAA